jgi:hypothetical protein
MLEIGNLVCKIMVASLSGEPSKACSVSEILRFLLVENMKKKRFGSASSRCKALQTYIEDSGTVSD